MILEIKNNCCRQYQIQFFSHSSSRYLFSTFEEYFCKFVFQMTLGLTNVDSKSNCKWGCNK